MEDQEAVPADGVAAAPFSDLIRDWLDEGDRLDENAAATTATTPSAPEGRFRQIALRVRPALDRYRVVLLAAVGLIPFALFTLTHHGPATPVLATATISNVPSPVSPPRSTPPLPAPSVAEAAAEPVLAPSPSPGLAVAAPPAAVVPPHHRSSHHRPKHRSVARRAR